MSPPEAGNRPQSLLESWGAALAYGPSMLLFAGLAPQLWLMLDLNFIVPTLTAYVAGGCLAATVPVAVRFGEHGRGTALLSVKWRRFLRIVLMMNWIPHHAALIVLGIAAGIQHEGLVP